MRFAIMLIFLFSTPFFAQAQNSSAATATAKIATTTAKHLSVDDIVAMVKAGLSDDVIIARLRKESTPFDLSPDDLIRLKKANVSDAIVKVMMDPNANKKPQNPEPVVIQSPLIPAIVSAHASGATPAAGVTLHPCSTSILMTNRLGLARPTSVSAVYRARTNLCF